MVRMLRLMLALALVLGAAVLAGCATVAEKATQKAVEGATGVQVDKDGDSVTIKTEDGEATISDSAKLPDGFPADVPIYDGATIASVFSNDVNGGKSYLVAMKSEDDAADEVFPWYKKAFEDQGWKIVSTMEVGDSVGGLTAEKGDMLVSLAIGYGAEKNAEISLTVAPKQ